MTAPLVIDGSHGEGGGQIVRTSLTLSMLTGTPVRIENLRARRRRPGLLHQHLTAVRAAAALCRADVRGAELGSRSLWFSPGAVDPGEYQFAVGTAGSATLVLQTILPPLLCAAGRSRLVVSGGTHNPLAPPIDFLERAYLPLVRRCGPDVQLSLERAGFYPAGGGRFSVEVSPVAALAPLTLDDRGELVTRRAVARVARLPRRIAERELRVVGDELGWPAHALIVEELPETWGPGNVVFIELGFEHVTDVVTGFGEKGVPAETVAQRAIAEARRMLDSGAAVGEHLADQLLLILAIAGGGAFTTVRPSGHTVTQAEIVQKFLPVRIDLQERGDDLWRIEVADRSPADRAPAPHR